MTIACLTFRLVLIYRPILALREYNLNQSSDIRQHSQNKPTEDRWIRLKNLTIQILKENSTIQDIGKK